VSTSTRARVTPPAPRALPAAAWVGPAAAVLLLALGVVAGQDALARWGVTSVGTSWLGSTLDGLDGLRAAAWTVPVGIALVVVGLLLLVTALKPRRRTHVQVEAAADLWLAPSALSALARDAAEGVPGVSRVSVAATRTAVRVRAAADHPDQVAGPVEEAVRARLAGAQVKVTVRTHRLPSEGAEL
jgi:hypothetical protein